MSDMPETIYLQKHEGFEGEHTWCWHQVHDDDVQYVRRDLVPQWRPISEAPVSDDPAEPIDFLATDGCFMKVCAYDGDDLMGWPHVVAPTHWMPLPKNPIDN